MDLRIEDCRTIFLDWILGHPGEAGPAEIGALLAEYGPAQPDHPMTRVLEEGLEQTASPPARRGGAAGRRRQRPRPADAPGTGRLTD
jgi:hypothetical protein